MKAVSPSHGRGRGGLVRLGRIVALAGGLMLLGAIYESIAVVAVWSQTAPIF